MFARAASRSIAQGLSKRNMGGQMGVHKNKSVEEWNGRREITEKVFHLGSHNVPILMATIVAFPCFVAYWTTMETTKQNKKGIQPNAQGPFC